MVGQRHFARHAPGAAQQAGPCRAVMGRPERAGCRNGPGPTPADPRCCKHGTLASTPAVQAAAKCPRCAGPASSCRCRAGPVIEQVVAAGGGDFQRSLGRVLPRDVRQVFWAAAAAAAPATGPARAGPRRACPWPTPPRLAACRRPPPAAPARWRPRHPPPRPPAWPGPFPARPARWTTSRAPHAPSRPETARRPRKRRPASFGYDTVRSQDGQGDG